MTRRSYTRPMDGWYARDPFFMRYMAREATALFVVVYAITLLDGLWHLGLGREAFDGWLANLQGGTAIALSTLLAAVFVYHTITWFQIMPKTLPPIVIAGRRLSAGAITAGGLAASFVASMVLFAVLRSLA